MPRYIIYHVVLMKLSCITTLIYLLYLELLHEWEELCHKARQTEAKVDYLYVCRGEESKISIHASGDYDSEYILEECV